MPLTNIVETPIDCLGPHNERYTLVVEIGQPYRVQEMEWACPVKIRGLYDRLPDVRGVDSLQALCQAASLVRSLLEGYLENGGKLVHAQTNDSYELGPTFSLVGDGGPKGGA